MASARRNIRTASPTTTRPNGPSSPAPAGRGASGALHHADFVSRAVQLLPGEALFLYSNGLTEARTSQGTRFGRSGLAAHLTALPDTFPAGTADDVALIALSATRHGTLRRLGHRAHQPALPPPIALDQTERPKIRRAGV
ncbi:SpoIIE family protein phosphatase [Streptomyces sp. 2A115]|uniref:SpoIIE family protein phosphatase n=1 Tax=Streptomyces sp. 2A115 TaxID=3457439 RepID=UPI003FD54B1A